MGASGPEEAWIPGQVPVTFGGVWGEEASPLGPVLGSRAAAPTPPACLIEAWAPVSVGRVGALWRQPCQPQDGW